MRQAFRDFEIVAPLVCGEDVAVYAARERATGREIALKVFSPLSSVAEGERAPLGAAAWLEGRLDHPSVVRVVGFDDGGEAPFLATEWIEGWPLDAAIWSLAHAAGEPGPLPADAVERLRKIVPLFAGVADALDRACRQGTPHGRLYPWNLLLAEDGERLQLTDFAPEPGRGLTAGEPSGEPADRRFYQAPEQRRPEPTAPDARTDVYAFGVVLYETVTLCLPHAATDPQNRGEHGRDADPVPAPVHVREIPPALDAILARCLAGDRSLRYASFAELRDALTEFLAAGAPPPASPEVEEVDAADERAAPEPQVPAEIRPAAGTPAPALVRPDPARVAHRPPRFAWAALAALTAASCWLLVLAASRWAGQGGVSPTPDSRAPSSRGVPASVSLTMPDRVGPPRAVESPSTQDVAAPRSGVADVATQQPQMPATPGETAAKPAPSSVHAAPPGGARADQRASDSPAGGFVAIAADLGPPADAPPLAAEPSRRTGEPEPPPQPVGSIDSGDRLSGPEDLRQAPYHPFGFGDPQVELTGMHGVVCDPRSGLPAAGAVVVIRADAGVEIESPPSDDNGGYSMPVEAGSRYEPVAVIAADGVRLPTRWRGLAIRIWSGRYVEINLCDSPGEVGSRPGDDGSGGSARSKTDARTVAVVAARGVEPRT